MKIKQFIILSLTLALTSCGSIMSRGGKSIKINSGPEKADVVITNSSGQAVSKGITPFTVKLRSGKTYFVGETYTLTFSKEGYKDGSLSVDAKINGWYFGNFILGGPIGMFLIDPLTGGMWTFRENEIFYPLTK